MLFSGIICFSVQFCDNWLLMLKMRFQAFSFATKKLEGFSDVNAVVIIALLSSKLCLSFLKF